MNRILPALYTAAFFVVAFTATAVAAGAAAPDDGSLLDYAKPVFDAVMSGNWWLGAALGVIFLTAVTRRYLPDAYGGKFARGDVGGMLTAFIVTFLGAVATTLAGPGYHALSSAMLLTGLKVGLGAVGGFVALHQLAKALVATKWFQDKAPAWLKTALAFLLKIIGSSAIDKAEKAGDAAVAANPPTGANGPAGGPTDI